VEAEIARIEDDWMMSGEGVTKESLARLQLRVNEKVEQLQRKYETKLDERRSAPRCFHNH